MILTVLQCAIANLISLCDTLSLQLFFNSRPTALPIFNGVTTYNVIMFIPYSVFERFCCFHCQVSERHFVTSCAKRNLLYSLLPFLSLGNLPVREELTALFHSFAVTMEQWLVVLVN
jgi:hypothetical protein